MLSVMIWILKLIGCAALIILGLLVLALCAVLFSAVAYRAEGSFRDGALRGQVRVAWLFHIVSLTAAYEDGLTARIRVFGVPLGRRRDGREESPPEPEEDPAEAGGMILKTQEIRGSGDGRGQTGEAPRRAGREPGERQRAGGAEASQAKEQAPRPEKAAEAEGETAGRVPGRILQAAQRARQAFEAARGKAGQAWEWKERASAWIGDEANRRSLRLIGRQGKRILRHLLPRKGQAEVVFGLDDPYLTGAVLKYAALFYPLYAEHIGLYPVFGRKVIEVEGSVRGRIRLGVLLGLAGRLLLDANIRKQARAWIRR